MLKEYNRDEEPCGIFNWNNVSSVTITQEKKIVNYELEELKNDRAKISDPTGMFSGTISKLFPKRKIITREKLVWVLKVDGAIVAESDNYEVVKADYNFYKNEWYKFMENN